MFLRPSLRRRILKRLRDGRKRRIWVRGWTAERQLVTSYIRWRKWRNRHLGLVANKGSAVEASPLPLWRGRPSSY